MLSFDKTFEVAKEFASPVTFNCQFIILQKIYRHYSILAAYLLLSFSMKMVIWLSKIMALMIIVLMNI